VSNFKKVNLTNLKSCGQEWEKMKPCQGGRLCVQCNKTIIDFRKFSDSQVAEIHALKTKPICGIYTDKQLELPTRNLQPKFKTQLFNSLAFSFFSFFSTVNSEAQTKIDTIAIVDDNIKRDSNSVVEQDSVAQNYFVQGVLLDENDEAVLFASILIKNTEEGTTTDFDGKFLLNVTDYFNENDKLVLKARYVGYLDKEITIDKRGMSSMDSVRIKMEPDPRLEFSEFVIIAKKPFHVRFWNKLKSIF